MASLRLTTFFRMSSDAGLVWFLPPPVRNDLLFSKAISSEPPAVSAGRSRAFFTSLNLLLLLASF